MNQSQNDEKDKLLESLLEQYNNDFKLSAHVNQSFQQMMRKIFDKKGIKTAQIFADKTGLQERYYDSFTNEMIGSTKRPYKPARYTLIAVCISLELDLPMTVELLKALGGTFSLTNPVHYAYSFLVGNFKGGHLDPEERYDICNEFLSQIGIDEKDFLGISRTRGGAAAIPK